MAIQKTLLLILDGWGNRRQRKGNAIALARTPTYDHLLEQSLVTDLDASGEEVGLPPGLMGNSNVGHLNIGCGRIVPQDIRRIDQAIQDRSFFENREFKELIVGVRERGSRLHLLGLLSDGGVHSHADHLYALVRMAKELGVGDVAIHAFLDGRDTPPASAREHVARLEAELARIGLGRIATISGRYYAMDRDQRWDRTALAWRALVDGIGEHGETAETAIEASYSSGVTDEFVLPTIIDGIKPATIDDGDGVIFFNFRADRARQMTKALTDPTFDSFERQRTPSIQMTVMTVYDADSAVPVAFPPTLLHGIFADVLADNDVPNLRIAETEKYAHVTYFFNGGSEHPWPKEHRQLLQSPKVATYDLEPAMRATAITDGIVRAMESGETPVIIANYANADMVGHTGSLDATIEAVEVLDAVLARILDAADRNGFALFLTADHGNAEQMIDPETNAIHTAHTTNRVPLIVRAVGLDRRLATGGRLADVVPTILDYWDLAKPPEMTGRSLLES